MRLSAHRRVMLVLLQNGITGGRGVIAKVQVEGVVLVGPEEGLAKLLLIGLLYVVLVGLIEGREHLLMLLQLLQARYSMHYPCVWYRVQLGLRRIQ